MQTRRTGERKVMIRRSKLYLAVGIFGFSLLALLAFFSFGIGSAPAADSKSQKTQNRVDVTVVHVDKYGVYAPNLIFYWDSEMSKQKITSLTSTAEQLRNKKATIVYTGVEELAKDKRPLIVEIIPLKEDSRQAAREAAPKEPSGEALAERDKTAKAAPKEEAGISSSQEDEEASPEDVTQQSATLGEEATEAATASETTPEPTSEPITKGEASALIRRILKLTEEKDSSSIMSYYADQVNYYNRGNVNKDYIRRDMGYYFRNWDKISCSLDGGIVLIATGERDSRIVKFVSAYSVANAKKSASGKTENIWKVTRINNALRIVDQKQKVINSAPTMTTEPSR